MRWVYSPPVCSIYPHSFYIEIDGKELNQKAILYGNDANIPLNNMMQDAIAWTANLYGPPANKRYTSKVGRIWWWSGQTIHFVNEQDAFAFRMRWC